MPSHVLVPVDGSDHGFGGLEYALESFPDATHTALYVVDPGHDHLVSGEAGETPPERAEQRGKRILERAADRGADRNRSIQTTLRTGSPHSEILEVAADEDVDHVVMGSHGTSPITRPFLGRVSEAVIRRAPVSTTVVPEAEAAIRTRTLPGSVLVPVDGSEQSLAALRYALETFPTGDHTVVHVLGISLDDPLEAIQGTYLEELVSDLERRGETVLSSATDVAADVGVDVETDTAIGKPATEIVEYAEAGDFDQLVMGSHGRSLAARLVTGSVAERVARRSSRTVTLVRGSPAARE